MTEEEIASLFEQVTRELDVPGIGALVSRAERRGRRMRHRQLAFRAAGTALAAGAIVVAGTTTGVVPQLTGALGLGSPASGGSPAATAGTSPSAAVSPVASATPPAAKPSPTPTPGDRVPMTAAQIMDDLRAMLPATLAISNVRDQTSLIGTTESPAVEINIDDGQGNADVEFGIYRSPFLQSHDCPAPYAGESPRPAGAPPESCTTKTLPDGSLLMDLVTGTDGWSFYDYEIDFVRPDGITISLAVGNGTLDPGTPSSGIIAPAVTRAVPPGSFAEWNAIAESAVWHL